MASFDGNLFAVTGVEADRLDTGAPVVPPWSSLSIAQVAAILRVDIALGLPPSTVADRRQRVGLNVIVAAPPRPKWKRFADQFRHGIVAMLAVAALVAGAVGDVYDTVVIATVLIINAVLGYYQEGKAASSLAALERMLVVTARVRRDSELALIPIDELVPGDVVLLEPGDRVTADGRIVAAFGLAIDESTLTGESVPVDKWADQVDASTGEEQSFSDRSNLAFMNSTVTRGRGEMLVVATGMDTEIGRVAELLSTEDPAKTPLDHQLGILTTRLAIVATVAAVLVFVLQMVAGTSFSDALLGAVALAVAAIPEGLPSVTTVTLAVGVNQMASRNAIVRRLQSVETLGSTTVICSDKTGTLTLNQMTAREIVRGHVRIAVSGLGYGVVGSLSPVGVGSMPDLTGPLQAMSLCSDAVVHDGELVGDPTEGAMVVLALKGGVDVDAVRHRYRRIGEVPFDSVSKYMATFHRDGDDLLCVVKGAPDRLIDRCSTSAPGISDEIESLDSAGRSRWHSEIERLATDGLRVLAVASRRIAAADVEFAPDGSIRDPDQYVADLTFEALVGMVDPPRVEVAEAIARCQSAGINVKMITGDHAATAHAVANVLGIGGSVVTGDEIEAMSESDLADRISGIGVCARVSPEHKVRVVRALQSLGEIVAMTGDGINDAAAVSAADIGVAMGVTGTEVTKGSADMVLADDNFATIVGAVERGRTIYANIVQFVRFELSTNLGAIGTILGAGLAGLPLPFSPIQVLWVNLIADGPPAMTLGVDPPSGEVMNRPPRRADGPILPTQRIVRLCSFAAVMTIGTLALLSYGEGRWGEEVATTMTFTVFVLFQMFNVFNSRTENESIFSRRLFVNWRLLVAVGSVVVMQFLATQWSLLQTLFGTVDLTATQLGCCFVVASLVIWVEELRKIVYRTIWPSARLLWN
ncbi:MAG: HAD-IC family P-type ATPase [Actinomycetes bacterium]